VLVLSASTDRPDRQAASFYSPHGHATLRVQSEPGAVGQVHVNGRVVPEAAALLARGAHGPVDITTHVAPGRNALTVELAQRAAFVSVDYPSLVHSDPAAAGFHRQVFDGLDALVASRAGTGPSSPRQRYAGAVILVAYRGQVVHEAAIGHAQTYDGPQPLAEPRAMTTDTIFDLASVTKPVATAAAILKLVDEAVLTLDDSLGTWLPELGADKAPITIRQMLTHRSGLWEWQPTYLHGRNQEEVLGFLAGLPLRYGIGVARHYSDIGGGMLPGVIVERATGQRLDAYLRSAVYGPLGMTDTGFTPDPSRRHRIAATSLGNPYEYSMIATGSPYPVVDDPDPADFPDWRQDSLVGEANDGNAWYGWEGVAGHAGLFSTARDIAVFSQALNNGGGYGNARLASPGIVASFLVEPYDSGQAISFRSRRLPGTEGLPARQRGFGHGGFTGTEFVFDPARDLTVVLLTNRQHPDNSIPYPNNEVWDEVLQRVLEALPDG
jgi:CubicO group peptidase (beta-lactamase class C family)